MSAGKTSLVLWLIGPAFLGVAAYLALASPPANIPIADMKVIPTDAVKGGAWCQAKVDARGRGRRERSPVQRMPQALHHASW